MRGAANYSVSPNILNHVRDKGQSKETNQYLQSGHSLQANQPNQSSTSAPSKNLFWKPKVESLDDLLNDFGVEDDLDMKLGSSILFENRRESQQEQASSSQAEEKYEPYDPEDSNSGQQKEEGRVVAPHLVRNAVNDLFNENPHPTACELVELSTKYRIRYRGIFDNMERKRISRGILCEEGDSCCRIKEWLEQENEPIMWPRMSEETKELLEKELELLIRSRRRFDLGNLHVIVEKTNLRPVFVRFQYQKWRQRLLSHDRVLTIEEWRSDSQRLKDVLSMETLRRLEEVYLAKKYQSDSTQWSDEELQELSDELNGLPIGTICKWLEKRNGAVDKLPNEPAPKLRRTDSPKRPIRNGRVIPPNKVKVLNEEFKKDDRPKKWKMAEMAQRLDLHETTVVNFFAKRRKFVRREKDWEVAREEVLLLPPDKLQMLEQFAAQSRKTSAENMEHAGRIGVTYSTLCSFVDWKKALKARRYTQYQYDL